MKNFIKTIAISLVFLTAILPTSVSATSETDAVWIGIATSYAVNCKEKIDIATFKLLTHNTRVGMNLTEAEFAKSIPFVLGFNTAKSAPCSAVKKSLKELDLRNFEMLFESSYAEYL